MPPVPSLGNNSDLNSIYLLSLQIKSLGMPIRILSCFSKQMCPGRCSSTYMSRSERKCGPFENMNPQATLEFCATSGQRLYLGKAHSCQGSRSSDSLFPYQSQTPGDGLRGSTIQSASFREYCCALSQSWGFQLHCKPLSKSTEFSSSLLYRF